MIIDINPNEVQIDHVHATNNTVIKKPQKCISISNHSKY